MRSPYGFLTEPKSSYIMAAIDRVVHHSVILDMMEVESYRATEANHHRKLQQEATKIEAETPAEIVAIGGS